MKSNLEKLDISSKTAIFANLGALNLVNLENFNLQKVLKIMKIKDSEPLIELKRQILKLWIRQL